MSSQVAIDIAPTSEIETKLLAPHASALAAIAQQSHVGRYRLEPSGRGRLHSVYLDTAERALAQNGIALRLRRRARQWEATVKWFGTIDQAVHARPELNVPLPGLPPSPFTLPSGPLQVWLSAVVAGRPLEPLVVTDIDRQTIDVFAESPAAEPATESLMEIALDRVRIKAPGETAARTSYSEVEVELKHGTRDDLAAVSDLLRDGFSLTPSLESKFVRGLVLLYGDAAPHCLVPTLPDATANVGDAVRHIVLLQLSRLRQHEPGTRIGADAEALHDMRVAVRRLRAALRIFDAAIARRTRESLRNELRWLGRALGAVRDLDVQRATLAKYRVTMPSEAAGALEWLDEQIGRERATRRKTMLAALDSRRYHRLLIRLEHLSDPSRQRLLTGAARMPLARTGRRALARTAKRVLEQGHAVADNEPGPSAEALHAVRIRAKRLRYLLEFLRELTGKAGRRVVKRLVRLQDLLGAHQDAIVAAEFMRVSAANAQVDKGALLALGGLIEAERQRAARARADFGRVWRRFAQGQIRKDLRVITRRLRRQAEACERHPIRGEDLL